MTPLSLNGSPLTVKKAEGTCLYDKASLIYDPAGTTIGYMGGVTDITDGKRSQEFMNRMKDGIESSMNPRIQHIREMIGKVPIPRDEQRTP